MPRLPPRSSQLPRAGGAARRSSSRPVLAAALAALAALLVAVLPACDEAPSRLARWQRATGPGLVVLLVIDQFPQWAFEQKLPELTAGGFRRLLSEGRWQIGEYPSAATITAPGHALLGSGEPPAHSGILSNEWWRRGPGRRLKSVEAEDGSVSAKWLRVPALGDAVAAAGTGARAVSVALKDRAAVLPLGHAGTPIWFSPKTVDWVTTQRPAPAWLAAWNRARPMAFHLHHVWTPLDAERLRRVTGRRDHQPGEHGDMGLGATFPHQLDKTRFPAEALLATPLGNQLVLETALAAIAGEDLGHDAVPDLLVVSLSSYDYVAHAWGHESWESWDTALRLDAQLAQFLDGLDRAVGAGRWSMLVTSDHGGSPLPELAAGGRTHFEQIEALANEAAATVLGPGDWVADPKNPTLYLSDAFLAQPAAQREAALTAIIAKLRAAPGLGRVERTADLAGHCDARPPEDRVLCLALDPEASGEIFYMPKRNWILDDADDPMTASHGTPFDYDRQVPLLTLPFGRAPHAPLPAAEPALQPMRAVSRTLAAWLGVTPPDQLPRAR